MKDKTVFLRQAPNVNACGIAKKADAAPEADVGAKRQRQIQLSVVNLAAQYMKLGQNDNALKLLDQDIIDSPSYARAWANRAVIRYKYGQMSSARSDAQTALRLDPANSQAQAVLSLLNSSAPLTSRQSRAAMRLPDRNVPNKWRNPVPVLKVRPVLFSHRARVAELADAPDSKSGGRKAVMVRPHSRAPLLQPLL
jgi:tetratricopeptide (TPR) repeat protein